MEIVDILFYLFTIIIIGCAILTVTLKHVLHAAICLMFTLFTTGALFLLMNAEFVALVQVMVYIGGVVIFIVYAILLTTDLGEKFLPVPPAKRAMAAVFTLLIAGIMTFLLSSKIKLYSDPLEDRVNQSPEVTMVMEQRDPNYEKPEFPTVASIGERLLRSDTMGFLIPFEVISVILLAALFAASTIARKSKREEEAAA